MKRILNVIVSTALGALLLAGMLGPGQGTKNDSENEMRGNIKRVGMIIGIRSDKIEEYKKLHADSNRGVRDLLRKYHMRNFSIFLQQLDRKWYEFGYYEYDGADFEGDMARLAAEPRNIEWMKLCDPLQLPLPGARGWTEMERIYFND
jgi:L-rhamnose mutarotase